MLNKVNVKKLQIIDAAYKTPVTLNFALKAKSFSAARHRINRNGSLFGRFLTDNNILTKSTEIKPRLMAEVALKLNVFRQVHKTNAKTAQTSSQPEITGFYSFHK
jgi:hypothetical protein